MSDEDSFKQQWFASDRARHAFTSTVDFAHQIQALTQRNYELTTLVTTLVEMLAESGGVDANVLLARVEGQLENEIQKPVVAPKPAVQMTTCARCNIDIPMEMAEMTANGLVCRPGSLTL
jgi:hypothetical protein